MKYVIGDAKKAQDSIIAAIRDAYKAGYEANGPYYDYEVEEAWRRYATLAGYLPPN